MAIAIRDAGRPLTPSEVAETLPQAHVSNVSAALRALATKGLLDQQPGPPRPAKHHGNWSKHCYRLSEAGNAALDSAVPESPAATENPPAQAGGEMSPGVAYRPRPAMKHELDLEAKSAVTAARGDYSGVGVLLTGAQLVLADATQAALPELYHALADAEPLEAAVWSGVLDGQEQTYLFAFVGDEAATQAMDLVALLAGARIDARRVTVTEISEIDELRSDLARRASVAKQSRFARDTREAGQG